MKDTSKLQMILRNVTVQAKQLLQEQLQAVILFGSYARGDEQQDSDIDIMLILNCSPEKARRYRRDISRIASRIGLEYDVVLSILFRTKDEFSQGSSYMPFYQNIIQEGVRIYG